MNRIILDGLAMRSRERAHDEIAHVLRFPPYYGRNLDALWDMVSTLEADVVLTDSAAMLEALGDYGVSLLRTLQEAAQENPRFRIEIRA